MGSLQKKPGRHWQTVLRPSILRFHILANSDSKTDQAVKLEIRSFLLDYIRDHLPESADSKNEGFRLAFQKTKPAWNCASQCFLAEKQIPYSAALSLERTWFPTRVYDDLVIPAAPTMRARLILGKGKGHNWWCVLYPRFCFLDEACREIPEESRRELQEKLNQGDYPCLRIIALN